MIVLTNKISLPGLAMQYALHKAILRNLIIKAFVPKVTRDTSRRMARRDV
jgi:hypothetical protein